jgi:hypothetical protein
MARMVRSNKYPAGFYELPPMPAVASQLHTQYESLLKGRLKAFPPANDMDELKVRRGEADSSKFRHLLRYDAESVFWCLVWWCIQARPDKVPDEELSHAHWSTLIDNDDQMRDSTFISKFPRSCLHSYYSKLNELLDDMRKHLQGDLDLSELKKGKPEYVHEAFQRLILNFLITYKDEAFMDLKKHHFPRQVSGLSMERNTRSTKRANPDDESTVSARRPRP